MVTETSGFYLTYTVNLLTHIFQHLLSVTCFRLSAKRSVSVSYFAGVTKSVCKTQKLYIGEGAPEVTVAEQSFVCMCCET